MTPKRLRRKYRQCKIGGCNGLFEARGYCNKHYKRLMKGSPMEDDRFNVDRRLYARKLNSYFCVGSTAFIETSNGKYCLVDRSDLPLFTPFTWYANRLSGHKWYAVAYMGRATGRKLMHRMLLGFPSGLVVDHVNGESMDNRRANLRAIPEAENKKNRRDRRITYPLLQRSFEIHGIPSELFQKVWDTYSHL